MKTIEWDNPNKMKFFSGHKAFDKQTNYISTENVAANTQYSSFIRSWNNDGKGLIDYDRNKREPEWLFNFDITPFKETFSEFRKIETDLTNRSKQWTESHILYAFFHINLQPYRRKILHGFVLTDRNHNHVKTWYFGSSYKSWDLVEEAKKYITNNDNGKDKNSN
jgi:hypothetical protein